MALTVYWTEAAMQDLEAAAAYIARDSARYACVLVRDAREAAQSLSLLAKRGRVVPELGDPTIRELFVCNYRLLYQVTARAVSVLGFVHGSRDLWTIWKKRR